MIDTNILVSAALLAGSVPALALQKALERFVLLYSEATWNELEAVLMRPKFDRYRAQEVRREYLAALREVLLPIEPQTKISICRHEKDNKFLELAVDGNAQFILTGDDDLLTLNPFRQIAIVSPMDFLRSNLF